MDSDYTYQPQYIWKTTERDGVLPVTNYTEDVKDQERGKSRGKGVQGKEIGIVTNFMEEEDPEVLDEGSS